MSMSTPPADSSVPDLSQWVGRRQELADTISPVQVRQMAAAFNDSARLDHPASAPLPAGWHWCYFNPMALQGGLGDDGHPRKGDFLPPVAQPRRMWAGSRLVWQRDFSVGRSVTRATEIERIERKQGRSGEMVFVTLAHRYSDDQGLVMTEAHDIVYRNAPDEAERAQLRATGERIASGEHAFEREGQWVKPVRTDEVMLFRYSAATFNGHRIHYDQPYCRDVEGYPGLVVHGPLIATLLLDWVERELGPALGLGGRIGTFSFKAQSPTFHLSGFHLHARRSDDGAGLDVWSTNNLGQVGLDGHIRLR